MNLHSILRHFTIRTRMRGAIAVVLLMFALLSAATLAGGWRLHQLNEEFVDHALAESRQVAALRQSLGDIRRHEKDMVIDYEDAEAVKAHRTLWLKAVRDARLSLESLVGGDDDEDNAIAREAMAALSAYEQATEPVLKNIIASNFDTARVASRQLDRAKQHVAEVETRAQAISEIIDRESAVTQAQFNQAVEHTLYAFCAVLALVVIIVIPSTLANSRSIVGPIEQARSIAQSIAEGDLTRPIEVKGRDELAQLTQSLKTMQDALARLVAQVRESSEGIHTASAEIATGNNDLSARTEQTASNLQQTSASMTQLTGTVKQSADAARQANQLASSSAEVAARGGQVVSQVVSTMDEINASSKKISDIIGVIDGIAFQTNILALNAAVEAARAGEQGRGFAVVAGEVRSLAGRSAEAAREIKGLIGASVERVEAGSRLVADAGQTMQEIVGSVQRVSDIIGEITAASAEQSDGIGQVNGSVLQLDQMTQQNAALVEESAAAAESLKDQASRLAQVVGRFRTAASFSSAEIGR